MSTRLLTSLAFVAVATAACGPTNGSVSSASAAQSAVAVTPANTQDASDTGGPPVKVGDCVLTSVKSVGTRLEGVAGSGSGIEYDNGVAQVSYDQLPGIDSSKAGDQVKLCLVSLPENCPPGDDRGKVYAATNQRTGQTWSEPNSEHSCGGAGGADPHP